MIKDDEIAAVLAELAKQYLHAPADRCADGFL